jgi:hypothetical protein
MPRRPTDRLEDAVAWLVVSLALLVALAGVVVGATSASDGRERATAERHERVPVRVVLLEPAVVTPSTDGLPVAVAVRGRWLLPRGQQRVAPIVTATSEPAGAALTGWVDRAGNPVPAPGDPSLAVVGGVLRGLLVLAVGWFLLALAWWRVRRWTAARNAQRWARGWARVEPAWSGRLTQG